MGPIRLKRLYIFKAAPKINILKVPQRQTPLDLFSLQDHRVLEYIFKKVNSKQRLQQPRAVTRSENPGGLVVLRWA